jgi:hypothetical protein
MSDVGIAGDWRASKGSPSRTFIHAVSTTAPKASAKIEAKVETTAFGDLKRITFIGIRSRTP